METPRFSNGRTYNLGVSKKATLQATGSLDSTQGSVCNWKVAGVQDLYACVVVAVERRHGARAPSRDRVCRVGKPYPEVVRLDRNGRHAGVQDEGLLTEDPSHIYYSSANCIGLQVALIPRRDEGCVRGVMTNSVNSVFAGSLNTSTCMF